MNNQNRKRVRRLCEAAVVAALYVALTELSAMIGMSSGVIQFRLSESLCVLAIFTPAAVPGVTLGCLVANLLTQCAPLDIIFGTFASFIGMLGCRMLKKLPYIAPIPYALSNMVIVPLILAYVYYAEESLPFLFLTVSIGEILSVFAVGVPLYMILKKHKNVIFK